MEGTRAKPGNQLVYYICIYLLDPHWTIPREKACHQTASLHSNHVGREQR